MRCWRVGEVEIAACRPCVRLSVCVIVAPKRLKVLVTGARARQHQWRACARPPTCLPTSSVRVCIAATCTCLCGRALWAPFGQRRPRCQRAVLGAAGVQAHLGAGIMHQSGFCRAGGACAREHTLSPQQLLMRRSNAGALCPHCGAGGARGAAAGRRGLACARCALLLIVLRAHCPPCAGVCTWHVWGPAVPSRQAGRRVEQQPQCCSHVPRAAARVSPLVSRGGGLLCAGGGARLVTCRLCCACEHCMACCARKACLPPALPSVLAICCMLFDGCCHCMRASGRVAVLFGGSSNSRRAKNACLLSAGPATTGPPALRCAPSLAACLHAWDLWCVSCARLHGCALGCNQVVAWRRRFLPT
jgi:hypothetical protein